MGGLRHRILTVAVLAAAGVASASPFAVAAEGWHVDGSIGDHGILALPTGYTWTSLLPAPNDGVYVIGRPECPEQAPPPEHEDERFAGATRRAGARASVCAGGKETVVAHVTAAGALDRGFGARGVAHVSIGDEATVAMPGGGLAIAGEIQEGLVVIERLTGRGTTDRSFGIDGASVFTLPEHPAGSGVSMVLQNNGELLLVYKAPVAGSVIAPIEFASIPASGQVPEPFPASDARTASGPLAAVAQPNASIAHVALTPSGSMLLSLSGLEVSGEPLSGEAVEQFAASGAALTGFGTLGQTVLSGGTLELNPKLAGPLFALPDGGAEIALGGTELVPDRAAVGGRTFAAFDFLFRLSATGQLNRQFAGDGLVRLPSQVEAFSIAPDGDTFAVGTVSDSLAVMEIRPNGSFSPAFDGRRGLRLETNLSTGALNEPVDVLAHNDSIEMLLAGTSIERVER